MTLPVTGVSPEQGDFGPPGRQALRLFIRNKAAVFGLVLLAAIVFMTLFGSFFYDQDPSRIIARPLQGPGEGDAPALGTDYLGRDVLAGVVNGGSTSLTVALVAVLTPSGDPLSLMALSIPMYLFYEFAIVFGWWRARKKAKADAAGS